MIPFRNFGSLDVHPQPMIMNYEDDDELIDPQTWNEVVEEGADLIYGLNQLHVDEDVILKIVALLFCERLHCSTSIVMMMLIYSPDWNDRERLILIPEPAQYQPAHPLLQQLLQPKVVVFTPIVVSFQKHDHGFNDSCPICLCEPTDDDSVFKCPKCHHEVCEGCMKNWLESHVEFHANEENVVKRGLHKTCPSCNSKLVDDDDVVEEEVVV